MGRIWPVRQVAGERPLFARSGRLESTLTDVADRGRGRRNREAGPLKRAAGFPAEFASLDFELFMPKPYDPADITHKVRELIAA
jgi:hypothetical protein